MPDKFTHLHVHSHYSIQDGMSKVPDLVDKCMRTGMHAMALTDHGNMFGIKELMDYVGKVNGAPKKKVKECQEEIDKEPDEKKKAELQVKLETLKAAAESFVPFKPIVGTEAYCARRTLYDKDKSLKEISGETGKERIVDRSGWHLILLAKNKKGYQNLCKLASIAYTDGFYDRPRIDHNVIEKWHEGIICCSACLGGEVPQYILQGNIAKAEESVLWFKNIFGDDYYLELQRHKTDKPNAATDTYIKQEKVNKVLIEFARKHNIKLIATNDVHFVEEEHSEAHERLVCLSTGRLMSDPNRGMAYTKQEWLKTPEEMEAIFSDIPEALQNTQEIVDKVEVYGINSDPIMPKFPIPEEFGTENEYRQRITEQELFDEFTRDEKGNIVLSQEDAEKKIKKLGGYEKLYRIKLEADYLNKLTWDGAKKRYGDTLTEEQRERITFELHIMKTMGFPGYFLIVQDYIRAAREELGVSVGPGRGSAAGSVVAYCLRITDLDPLKYDLLFERFLNPDRISLPDIDVDFDDAGRGKVLEWVTQKYGAEKVAHIITYGTMAAKSSIADVGRVQDLPLSVVNQIKSYIPDDFTEEQVKAVDGSLPKKMPKVTLANCYKYVPELRAMLNGPDPNIAQVLTYAQQLENTNRQIGIHACGVIIGADDLTNFAPICTITDKATGDSVAVTQYDGHVVESVGLIKMDFLGLSTLSLIKEALKNIRHTRGVDIDIDHIPIDDEKTYQLYGEGKTIGTFQFESPGMQKYLRELKPTQITDLIAMNALYRPGPIEYIPTFIARKLGKEPIEYDIPVMETYLKDTYGVTVYQEQVMLLSRLLANFTRGEADTLRKAMGKKIFAMLAILKPKFIEGGKKNGHDPKILEKIWADWEKFASYAFNKSHAACYAWVAYQTGYLKANYPAEYMAANLTQNKNEISKVTKFMDECKEMGINVKGPNVNESEIDFTVNKQGDILFGMGGVKGVGEGPVRAIIEAREKGGPFKSIYDFVERVNLQTCNRKAIESLALAGAFDGLKDIAREQFFMPMGDRTGSEILVQYGNNYQNDKNKGGDSLFGDMFEAVEIAKPELPQNYVKWSDLERLNREREVVGIYLSSHPLDMYSFEMKYVINTKMAELTNENLPNLKGRQIVAGGIVTGIRNGISKKGSPYAIATIEDKDGKGEIALFGEDYGQYASFFTPNAYVVVMMTIEDKWNNGNLRKNINKVFYMQQLLSKNRFRSLTLRMPAEMVDNQLIEQLNRTLKRNKVGATTPSAETERSVVPVNIQLIDNKHHRKVNLYSRTHSVELGPDIMHLVEETPGIEMELQ